MEEAREKQKAASRKTRISELNRLSFCTDRVDWKWGIRGRGDGVSPLRRDCGERMMSVGDADGDGDGGRWWFRDGWCEEEVVGVVRGSHGGEVRESCETWDGIRLERGNERESVKGKAKKMEKEKKKKR